MLVPYRAAAFELVDELLVGLVEVEPSDPALADQIGNIEAGKGGDLLHVVADTEQSLALAGRDPAAEVGHIAEEVDLAISQARRRQEHLG